MMMTLTKLILLTIILQHLNETVWTESNVTRCLFAECTCSVSTLTTPLISFSLQIKCISQQNGVLHEPQQNNSQLLRPPSNVLISKLELTNYNMSELTDPLLFSNLAIGELQLANNSIKSIGANVFSGVKRINTLRIIQASALRKIDPSAFVPLRNTLRVLQLSANLTNTELNSLVESFKQLEWLYELDLSGNRLETLDARITNLTSNLRTLRLTDNQIHRIDSNAFGNLDSLAALYLDRNRIDNLTSLLVALDPTRRSLETLDVSRNLIGSLVDFPFFNRLNYVSLAANRIPRVSIHNFNSLVFLETLDLSTNLIKAIEPRSFENLLVLETLLLGSNHIGFVPDFFSLINLKLIYLNDQSSALNFIGDFAFERFMPPFWPVTIYLNGNENLDFGPKAFCSHNYPYTQLQELVLSYSAFENFNKCHFKQLAGADSRVQKTLTVVPSGLFFQPLPVVSTMCNCDFMTFATISGFRIRGACEHFQVDVMCAGYSLNNDDCSKDFDCQAGKSANQSLVVQPINTTNPAVTTISTRLTANQAVTTKSPVNFALVITKTSKNPSLVVPSLASPVTSSTPTSNLTPMNNNTI